jgi:hypothetical protein
MGQNATALFDPTIDDAEFQRRTAEAVAAMRVKISIVIASQ